MYLVSLGNVTGGVARIPVLILMRETNLLVELASIGFQQIGIFIMTAKTMLQIRNAWSH
jgi:hypothetical protein